MRSLNDARGLSENAGDGLATTVCVKHDHAGEYLMIRER
jgi:hypothetical protein